MKFADPVRCLAVLFIALAACDTPAPASDDHGIPLDDDAVQTVPADSTPVAPPILDSIAR